MLVLSTNLTMNTNPIVSIYTDGSSRGNPGKGGYGCILFFNDKYKELAGGFRLTTNNRMELMAVIVGLEALKVPCQVVVVSDSKYVVDAVEKKWLYNWIKTGFKGKKNEDLWKRYYTLSKNHIVQMQWVKGHNNHPHNERCDQLATLAADGTSLEIDFGYEAIKSI